MVSKKPGFQKTNVLATSVRRGLKQGLFSKEMLKYELVHPENCRLGRFGKNYSPRFSKKRICTKRIFRDLNEFEILKPLCFCF